MFGCKVATGEELHNVVLTFQTYFVGDAEPNGKKVIGTLHIIILLVVDLYCILFKDWYVSYRRPQSCKTFI